jgi:hypothetical protein
MGSKQSPGAAILAITAQVPLARALACVVEFGIADRIEQGPGTAGDLAAELGLNADALYRVMRMLAASGIFTEDERGTFSATPLSSVLAEGTDGSVRDLLRLPWQEIVWQTYLAMPHTLVTGEPAFDHAHGKAFFEYLAEHADANNQFDAGMALISGPEEARVAEAYPYGRHTRLVDIGGGRGGLLAAVLARHKALSAVLFDQQQVVDGETLLDPSDAGRCELVAGDFFESVPGGADLYLMKRILHDWDDDQVLKILGCCSVAMTEDARLLIVEAIVAPGNTPDVVKAQDVGMMLLSPGRERTLVEYERLLANSKLRVLDVHPVAPPANVSIIEVGKL